MFESDDFDQVLSQFDFPEVTNLQAKVNTSFSDQKLDVDCDKRIQNKCNEETLSLSKSKPSSPLNNASSNCTNTVLRKSPEHSKRKLINSHFDTNTKRKFPGPAGLLSGNVKENANESICHMELLSQDVEFTQNNLVKDLFESPLWARLLGDLKTWNLHEVNMIKMIKQQALAGNLRKRKAQVVAAYVEAVDRSAIDPLIILRDTTGSIKCTLHRDAWSTFSPYISSEYCALVLLTPTVLTTGSAFKKHYLNITLSNIYAIYSSVVLDDDEDKPMPPDYEKVSNDGLTLIKMKVPIHSEGPIASKEQKNDADLLEGLDISLFTEDLF